MRLGPSNTLRGFGPGAFIATLLRVRSFRDMYNYIYNYIYRPIGSMGLVYLPTWMVDFYGKLVGIYIYIIHGSYGIYIYTSPKLVEMSKQTKYPTAGRPKTILCHIVGSGILAPCIIPKTVFWSWTLRVHICCTHTNMIYIYINIYICIYLYIYVYIYIWYKL